MAVVSLVFGGLFVKINNLLITIFPFLG